ncbi:hypothetical protein NP493_817g00004 [Ridgeia piscesae]|uniref:Uncharacterized protein n=1 Tax=Ridgeia piscesae TaxID=27915 RepID=A0AAD9NMT5_RIDPI|nr:hypothetical protein NP493_817g00004 [Ridgeia piscesae]
MHGTSALFPKRPWSICLSLQVLNEPLQVGDLSLELVDQFLLHSGRVDDAVDGVVHHLSQLLRPKMVEVFEIEIEFVLQFVDDHVLFLHHLA